MDVCGLVLGIRKEWEVLKSDESSLVTSCHPEHQHSRLRSFLIQDSRIFEAALRTDIGARPSVLVIVLGGDMV